MAELESTKKCLISSIELLSKTGISRATLNDYIKMGMIPPPMVRKPIDPYSKAKRIGYFGYSVVETIETISVLKLPEFNEFGSAIEIVNMFGGKPKYLELIQELEYEIDKEVA